MVAVALAGAAAGARAQEPGRAVVARDPTVPGAALQRDRRAVQTSRETRTLAIGPNGELRLETVSGDITVSAGGDRDVVVEITRESRGQTDADAKLGLDRVRADVEVNGSRASVRAEYPNENRPPYSVNVSYRVTAPAGTHIEANVVSGNLTATGIHGGLTLDTISGNVRVMDAARMGELTSVSGDVTIERSKIDGTLEAKTTSGSVKLTDVNAGRVEAGTVSGDVTLQRVTATTVNLNSTSGSLTCTGELLPRARYQLQAHSGDIHLVFSGGTGFEFDGNSFSGTIRMSPPIQASGSTSSARRPRQILRGTVGDGSAYINATTFSGNITVDRQ